MPKRVAIGVAASLVLGVAALNPTGLHRAAAQSSPACDYSFLVGQPIFKLVAPEESGTDVSLVTPLGIATEGSDFNIIKNVELVPEAGPILTLPSKFKPLPPSNASHRSQNFENPAEVVATMQIPQLKPSTTYDVVFTVKTLHAPAGCPKSLTEHIARFTT